MAPGPPALPPVRERTATAAIDSSWQVRAGDEIAHQGEAHPLIDGFEQPWYEPRKVDGLSLAMTSAPGNRNVVRITFRNANDETRSICLGLDVDGHPSFSTLALIFEQQGGAGENQYRIGRLVNPAPMGRHHPYIVPILPHATYAFVMTIDPFLALGCGEAKDEINRNFCCRLQYTGGILGGVTDRGPSVRWDPVFSTCVYIDGKLPDFQEIPANHGPLQDLDTQPEWYTHP
jgi:hypothetical protein